METTQVLLIRHGQSLGNAESRFGGHSPTPLSEFGRIQAAATARALAHEQITAIYSSDLFRAVETAQPTAERRFGEAILPGKSSVEAVVRWSTARLIET